MNTLKEGVKLIAARSEWLWLVWMLLRKVSEAAGRGHV